MVCSGGNEEVPVTVLVAAAVAAAAGQMVKVAVPEQLPMMVNMTFLSSCPLSFFLLFFFLVSAAVLVLVVESELSTVPLLPRIR